MLSSLNPEQKIAASHVNGPLLVIAGAGSGKTKALTHRIAYLLSQGIRPQEILAVTFTNKAAGEMKERVIKLLGDQSVQPPLIGTFHSIGVRILRREIEAFGRESSFTVFDSADVQSLVKILLKERNIPTTTIAPKMLISVISTWKNQMISPKKAIQQASNYREKQLAELYAAYQEHLEKSNALDFDDLILLPVLLFERFPEVLKKYQTWWKYVMIDEYQDTNYLQYSFAKMICENHRNICAIGDADQSIYRFRGADLSNLLNFQKEYADAKIVKLEQNYRSTKNILQAADAVIAHNSGRIPKTMRTENEEGSEISVWQVGDEREEAEMVFQEIMSQIASGVRPSEIAILYRTNAQSRTIEEAALRHALPYTIVGGLKFYARAEVKDILAYLRLMLNENDEVSLQRIINVPARKIGQTSLDRLKNAALERGISMGKMLAHVPLAEGIPSAAKAQMVVFAQLIDMLREKAKISKLSDTLHAVMEKSGYEEMLKKEGEEGEVRLQNIRELISVAQKYDDIPPERALSLFLEEVALVSDLDGLEEVSEKITLMTLHASKGLEFSVVFLVGCEENIFPSSRSMFDPEDLEEERRLMYVGITRAKKKLSILCANSRMLYGDISYNKPSRFLAELPAAVCDGNYFAQKSSEGFRRSGVWEEPTDISLHNYEVGDLVDHQKFGIGKIMQIEGDILTIVFKNAGEKRMVASIAPLKKVDPEFL